MAFDICCDVVIIHSSDGVSDSTKSLDGDHICLLLIDIIIIIVIIIITYES